MDILKVKMIDGGVRGLEVWYDKSEAKGGMNFNNEYHVKIKVPISADLRKKFIDMEKYLDDLLGLSDKVSLRTVTGVSIKNGMLLTGIVTPGVFGQYGVATMLVTEEAGYSKYLELSKAAHSLMEDVKDWIVNSTVPTAKQILIDFKEHGKENVKKSLSEYNFDEMTEEDALVKATHLLEKSGALVILNQEMGGDDSDTF